MQVSAKIYNLEAREVAAKTASLDIAPDGSVKAFDLPKPDGLTPTYFLKLQLTDAAGKPISDNFYWLSTKPDVLDWAHQQDTVYTPQKTFADLKGLDSLPQVKLQVTAAPSQEAARQVMHVTVHNPSAGVAFMVHLRLSRGPGGDDLAPILWQDNYFSLLPGESRQVSASYDPSLLNGAPAVLEVGGFNIVPETIP